MAFLTGLLIVLEIVCSLLLIGVILIQRTKGQGMGLGFGAQMGETIFGAQMGNVLTKTTVILAIIFLVNTTMLAMLGSHRRARSVTSDLLTPTVAVPAADSGSQPMQPMAPMPMQTPADASDMGTMAAPAGDAGTIEIPDAGGLPDAE